MKNKQCLYATVTGSGALSQRGVLSELPLFVDRKARKGQPRSTLEAKLAEWLESPEAKDWKDAREKLWQTEA